ncbi:response regulator [Fibrella forsythiae]|uniref:Response regulator n=1 Tax=Fibrella forsythiae TaxID=2817061 RepID=A0ABS3JMQ9_9BACT|nr:response regulator [Fibrella forsythiae]MBO0951291.1 response regulator [Fibrella forsythiae]
MTYLQDNESIRANFKRARILVVEDNDDYWVLIQRAMLQMLPEVVPIRAASRDQAHDLLAEWSRDEWDMPKLVLLDLYLPERNQGWQVLSDIRGLTAPFNQVPVVMLSSSNMQADISEAYRRGSSSYLVKPTVFTEWLDYFKQLRTYWWETVTLPPMRLAF